MSIWKKLFTAVKGGVNEAAETIADSQALRILDQEIREAKEELRQSDRALASIIAKRKLSEQKVQALAQSISEYEQHAISAMEKGEEALALECAERVSKLRDEQEGEQRYLDQFSHSADTLRNNITQAKEKLRQLEQQVDVVKATETVQKAQAAVSARNVGANSKMRTAVESLDRIKQKQAEQQAKLEAAAEQYAEESGDALQAKLKQAGITGSANNSAKDELARILARKQ
ncbi:MULTISPECIES: PspA/IM30 family protein [Plesiomonas]|uniref:PspA/IM30 family protein n=1 Tax=Plesiomonas TaxID=702 RepID=UPI0007ED142D|nr:MULTISPECIES: PspA/IM30 family protein [Plesiomonas]KAB7686142.1 PspA/IM30 family protein [Plesiomonas shigelloides]MCE5164193.1 PspA/IM30 family protein [Plesiomonas sp. PI-19]SBT60467.1 PspA/IM30 family [Plesiomonas shigelloides]